MKTNPFRLCLIALGLAAVLSVHAANSSISSKLYVADTTGDATVLRESVYSDVRKAEVYSAPGTTIETKPKASVTMVYSNNTGVYVDQGTRVRVQNFQQEPFVPDRMDLSMEPSISRSDALIDHGLVTLCASKLVAGSSMIYRTPQATINIRGRKIAIQVEGNETRVYALEGEFTVSGRDEHRGQTLKEGDCAIVKNDQPEGASFMEIQPIADNLKRELAEKTALACDARKTVFFDVVGQGKLASGGMSDSASGASTAGPAGEIVARPVVPIKLPTEFTVSPARLLDSPAR